MPCEWCTKYDEVGSCMEKIQMDKYDKKNRLVTRIYRYSKNA